MDRQKLISIVGLLVALLAAIGPQIDVMIPEAAFGIGLAGVALAAFGRGLVRTGEGNLAVTVIGCVVGVTGAVVPLLTDYPRVGAVLMLAGTVAAVFGRQLFNFDGEGNYRGGAALALVLSLSLVATQTACSTRTVRSVAAGVVVASQELRAEVAEGLRAGDYTKEEAAFINPIIDELEGAAVEARDSSINWERMNRADRLALASLAIRRVGGAVERLSAQGIGIKSERGRQRLQRYVRRGRQAVAALRIIEAVLSTQSEGESQAFVISGGERRTASLGQ